MRRVDGEGCYAPNEHTNSSQSLRLFGACASIRYRFTIGSPLLVKADYFAGDLLFVLLEVIKRAHNKYLTFCVTTRSQSQPYQREPGGGLPRRLEGQGLRPSLPGFERANIFLFDIGNAGLLDVIHQGVNCFSHTFGTPHSRPEGVNKICEIFVSLVVMRSCFVLHHRADGLNQLAEVHLRRFVCVHPFEASA